SAEDEVVADILLDKAVSIVAAIGQVHVLDLGLQLAPIVLGDLAAEDNRDLVRLSDGSIGVKQAFAKHVQCCTATKDEVVAELDLREDQPVLAARLLALSCAEEGCELRQPPLATANQMSRRQRVGEFLQTIGRGAFQEGIGALLESDAILAHAIGQPMVLIEADTGGERKVRADAHEHPPPVLVIDVKVVLNDPALRDLKMPSVHCLIADGNHDTRGLTRFEDDRHGAGLGSSEVRINEFVATALRRLYDRDIAIVEAPKG